ncbi:hypothetical protein AKO1_007324 [Acrasis kona]|uniref:PH domain-containing protein n=1 Tax=Acrasis kona TaxID=1008807 RepID=A0AAW2YS67_9EUKA
MKDYTDKIEQLTLQADQHKSNHSQLEQSQSLLSQQLQQSQQEASAKQSSLIDQINTLKENITQLEQSQIIKQAQAQDRIQALQDELQQSFAQISHIKSDNNQQIQQVHQSQLEQLKSQSIKDRESYQQEKNQWIQQSSQITTQHQQELQQLRDDHVQLTSHKDQLLNDATNSIGELTTKVNDLNDRIKQYQSQINQQSTTIQDQSSQITTLTSQNESLANQLSLTESQHASMCNDFKIELDQINQDKQHIQERVILIDQQKDQLEARLNQVSAELTRINDSHMLGQREVANMRELLESTVADQRALLESNQLQKNELEQSKLLVQQLQSQHDGDELKIQNLQQELKQSSIDHQQALSDRDVQANELKQLNEKHLMELITIRDELKKAQQASSSSSTSPTTAIISSPTNTVTNRPRTRGTIRAQTPPPPSLFAQQSPYLNVLPSTGNQRQSIRMINAGGAGIKNRIAAIQTSVQESNQTRTSKPRGSIMMLRRQHSPSGAVGDANVPLQDQINSNNATTTIKSNQDTRRHRMSIRGGQSPIQATSPQITVSSDYLNASAGTTRRGSVLIRNPSSNTTATTTTTTTSAPTIALNKSQTVIKSGLLIKEGGMKFASWQKKHIALVKDDVDGRCKLVVSLTADSAPQEEFDLTGCSVALAPEKQNGTNRFFCFKVTCADGKVVHLNAAMAEDRQDWMQKICP